MQPLPTVPPDGTGSGAPARPAKDNTYFGVFLLALLIGGFLVCAGATTYSYLEGVEEKGGRVRMNVVLYGLWSAFGKKGTALICVVPGALALVVAVVSGLTGLFRLLFVKTSDAPESAGEPRETALDVAPAAAAPPAAPDPAGPDRQKLQGRWAFVEFTGKTETFPDGRPKKRWAVFWRDRMTWTIEGDEQMVDFHYTLDVGSRPKGIDFEMLRDKGDRTGHRLRGSYELEGDTLRLCYWRGESEPGRPQRFEPDPATVLAVLKRVPAQAGKVGQQG
jgi:uncharacterized protein (TIGR03067 family)